MKVLVWGLWLVTTMVVAGFFMHKILIADDKSALLIGPATHGHHQIELACETCHSDAFGAGEVLQDACVNCHQEELLAVDDSHPRKKFTDPRNADLLEIIDARYCVSCHTEHQSEQTVSMGVTLPTDYCFHCHQEVGDERPSHQGLAFDSCASAGCHNYHDNKALYEDFLVKNAGQNWLNDISRIAPANSAALKAPKSIDNQLDEFADQQAQHPQIYDDWLATRHGQAGVTCASCHTDEASATWLAKPTMQTCQNCHQDEVKGFTQGKHGMRLAKEVTGKTLSPMSPALVPEHSHLVFHEETKHAELTCNSCHSAHRFDRQTAAVDSCLTCHADDHSQAFMESPHGQLWQQASEGLLDTDQAVTCASCHLPRIEKKQGDTVISRVEHNQNASLRPNEKMIRPVCMQCHGLEFSIDALADPALIKNNFNGQPAEHIESVDWAVRREQ